MSDVKKIIPYLGASHDRLSGRAYITQDEASDANDTTCIVVVVGSVMSGSSGTATSSLIDPEGEGAESGLSTEEEHPGRKIGLGGSMRSWPDAQNAAHLPCVVHCGLALGDDPVPGYGDRQSQKIRPVTCGRGGPECLLIIFQIFLNCKNSSVSKVHVLDCLLGHNEALFRRAQLKALVHIHNQEAGKGGELTQDETTIISGALDLTEKVQICIKQLFCMNSPFEPMFHSPVSMQVAMTHPIAVT